MRHSINGILLESHHLPLETHSFWFYIEAEPFQTISFSCRERGGNFSFFARGARELERFEVFMLGIKE